MNEKPTAMAVELCRFTAAHSQDSVLDRGNASISGSRDRRKFPRLVPGRRRSSEIHFGRNTHVIAAISVDADTLLASSS